MTDHIKHIKALLAKSACGVGLSMSLLTGCGKVVESPVPNWRVYYEFSPQQTAYRSLLAPGGMVLIPQSEVSSMSLSPMGIAVLRSLTSSDYYAFDLACPVETNPLSRLEQEGLALKCPRCGSRFDVTSGAGVPVEGIAQHPLRRYRASLTARGTILVVN